MTVEPGEMVPIQIIQLTPNPPFLLLRLNLAASLTTQASANYSLTRQLGYARDKYGHRWSVAGFCHGNAHRAAFERKPSSVRCQDLR